MKSISTVALATALAALAGPAAAQTAEGNQWALRMIGAQAAYDRGYTGRGVVVGILDSGLDMTHPEFAGRIAPFSMDAGVGGPVTQDPEGHGTHVAGIIGAARDGRGTHGVAYDVTLMPLGLAGDALIDLDEAAAGLTRLGLANGARIFNNSWGMDFYLGSAGGRNAFDTLMIQQTAQYRAAAAQDAIIVFSTGNEYQLQPNVQAGLPYYVPELQPHWLAVTAVGPDGSITDYANNCGLAAAWCLAAPGGEAPADGQSDDNLIISTLPGGGYGPMSGTSMAAPHVTGAVAIARQMFPNARASDLTRLTLATAVDVGAPGIDAEYGWGLLNLANMAQTRDGVAASVFANGAWSAERGQAALIETLGERAGANVDRGIWGAVLAATGEHDATASSNAAEAETLGGVAGFDLAAGPDATVGVALSYVRTELTEAGLRNEAEVKAASLSGYGALRSGGVFVEVAAGVDRRKYAFSRGSVTGAAGTVLEGQGLTGQAESDGFGAFADGRLGLGFATPLGELRPFVHGRVQHQQIDGFDEGSADVFSLSVPDVELTRTDIGPGVELALAPFDVAGARVSGALGLRHDFTGGDDDIALPAVMLGSAVPGAVGELGDATTVSAGLSATFGPGWEAGLGGFWTHADLFDQGGVSISLRARF